MFTDYKDLIAESVSKINEESYNNMVELIAALNRIADALEDLPNKKWFIEYLDE